MPYKTKKQRGSRWRGFHSHESNSNIFGMRLNKNTRPSDIQGRNRITHTSPVTRTEANSGLHLKANKQYLKNEQRKANMRLNYASV